MYAGYESDSTISMLVNAGSPENYVIIEESVTKTRRYDRDTMARQEKSQMEVMMEMLFKMR